MRDPLEFIESTSRFTISLDGSNEIDAQLLINTLSSCASILQDTTSFTCPDAYLNLKISPFRPGSFQVDFNALLNGIAPLIPHALDLAKSVCDAFIVFIKIKEVLKGKKPKQVIPDGELITIVGDNNTVNPKITVKNEHYHFYQKPQINEAVSAMFAYLDEDGTRTGMTIKSDNELFTIPCSEFKSLSKPEIFDDQEESINESVSITDLFIKKPDLMGNSKWGFYDSRGFDATVEDESFLSKVKHGDYIFRSGDKIRVKLKTVFHLDLYGFPIPHTEKFYVLEVLDVIEKDKPINSKQIEIS